MIDALLQSYPLTTLLGELKLSKSRYHYDKNLKRLPEKYATLRRLIKEIFIENNFACRYRRIHA